MQNVLYRNMLIFRICSHTIIEIEFFVDCLNEFLIEYYFLMLAIDYRQMFHLFGFNELHMFSILNGRKINCYDSLVF